MYLRHTIRKKDGKVHRTCRLVRSVRVGRRVIQQTVAQLGGARRARQAFDGEASNAGREIVGEASFMTLTCSPRLGPRVCLRLGCAQLPVLGENVEE